MSEIKNLIICGPYEKPSQHWKYDRNKRKFDLVAGRRSAGFLIASQDSKSFDDPGEFRELELVNKIRDRVDDWRDRNYPNVTGITKQLLEFWKDKSKRDNRFFFCQIEAIETLIWLVEGSDAEKQGINIPSDGGLFQRLCCKMATGTGKTVVMAMAVAWQVVNKVTFPQDTRFSKNILIMAPGLTVKSRLQVLFPTDGDNFYDSFNIIPESFRERLFQGKFKIHNWHTLMPETDAPRNVVKLGEESNGVFSKRILDHDLKNIIVINDEAHHAYRANTEQIKNISKADLERDKRWIEGLDKIHDARNIIHCFDFSATPFIPSGKNVSEDTLFGWIVSDFSLNDAIESGLTKTPRIAIRDDSNKFSKEYRSRFYHLYKDDEVKPDLNRNAEPHEKLPDLVSNAYFLLGQDWIETKKYWDKKGSKIPPVMITVCNKTATAARVMHSFEKNRFELKELSVPEHLLHIDSTTINKAEEKEIEGKTDEEESLRKKVDTVGKMGKTGEQIRNIVAVQMLSEGWDARNVTHIMGLRAFSSQLLCEQVVGRGLRRTSYEVDPDTGLFSPEHVNVFGVPFTFLPHEGGDGTPPPPTMPTTTIEPDPDKAEHRISWPNIERIDVDFLPQLAVDWEKIKTLELRSDGISTTVGMAQVLAGKPHVDKMSEIDLHELNKEIRLQRIIFLAAKDVYDSLSPSWKGGKEILLIQIVRLVEEFIHSDKINVTDVSDDELRRKMTILFNMQKVVAHVCKSITDSNVEKRQIHLNSNKPIKSTSDMRPWSTKKPAEYTVKSHINLAVYDSKWEMSAGQELERNKNVNSWVRNDHIGFVIKYMYNGILHDYYPDFLIRLENNATLVLEIKGIDNNQNKEKRRYLEEWAGVVNENGGYGTWVWDVAFHPSEVRGIITKHARTKVSATEYAKCPKCGKIAQSRQEVEKGFGFRNIDGIARPQSWCRNCRKS
ncbi:MAG: type III restriction endonuclease subunit R [Nitrosopumilus sp. H13]|nr:MAG: type III restriction endonuclease subunit R [Nitrosopumilus sp. H13]